MSSFAWEMAEVLVIFLEYFRWVIAEHSLLQRCHKWQPYQMRKLSKGIFESLIWNFGKLCWRARISSFFFFFAATTRANLFERLRTFFFLIFTTFAGSLARNGLRRRRQRKLVGRCVNIAVFMMNSNGFGHILGWWYAFTYVQAVYLFRYTFQMGDSGQSARQLLVYFVVAVISTVAVSFNNTSFF